MLWKFATSILCTLAIAGSVQANALDEHMANLAKRVAAVCQEDGFTSVMIDFEHPKSTKSGGNAIVAGSGPQMLKSTLAEMLTTQHNIQVKKFRAAIRLAGEIVVDEFGDESGSKGTTGIALDVTVRFIDRQGKPIVSLRAAKIAIEDNETISLILGVPFDDTRTRPTSSNSATPIADGFLKPKQAVTGDGIITAKSGSPFAIQLLAGGNVGSRGLSGSSPVSAGQEDGIAFVELKRNQEFSVRLINNADFEVGVALTLDGVDSFHFTKSKSMWLVPPRSSVTVNGWQLDGKRAKRFTIFPLEESVAHQLGFTDGIGVIQASFSRTWPENQSPPPGEEGAVRSSNAVGAGRNIASNVRGVKRNIGRLRASIPVRYERP